MMYMKSRTNECRKKKKTKKSDKKNLKRGEGRKHTRDVLFLVFLVVFEGWLREKRIQQSKADVSIGTIKFTTHRPDTRQNLIQR